MSKKPPNLAFDSFEDLAEVLHFLRMRLHFLNRVAIGESALAWHYAELLGAMARLAPLLDGRALRAEFGDDRSEGADLDAAARTERLLELLRAEM